MKNVNYNAVTLLFEKLESLGKQRHDSWKCIYLDLASRYKGVHSSLHTNFIIRGIHSSLAGDEGTVYLCEDGDIFILFRGPLKPIVHKLSQHFADLNPAKIRERNKDSLFTLFDLGSHWQEFYELCDAKYIHTLAAQEKPPEHYAYFPAGTRAVFKPSN